MKRRNYIFSMIGVAGTSSYIKYISDEAQAKITDFSVTDSKDTDNIIELESTDGVVNGLNFNIGEFNIETYNFSNTNSSVKVKFEAKIENESWVSLGNELYELDFDSDGNLEDPLNKISTLSFPNSIIDILNDSNEAKEITLKSNINHEDISELSKTTKFKLDIIEPNLDISSTGETYYDNGDIVHKFTSDGELIVDEGGIVEVLIVGGGGGGGNKSGRSNQGDAGGGGAGEYYYNKKFNISEGIYDIFVGDGGIPGENGNNSKIDSLITVLGGGRGAGKSDVPAGDGGSGGGGSSRSGGSGSAIGDYQGNSGGIGSDGNTNGGGGGGASESGYPNPDGSHGGDGLSNDIEERGVEKYYAGGGAGARDESPTPTGGLGGGGGEAENGTDYLGGGGGGGNNSVGGYGGDGVIIMRYENTEELDYYIKDDFTGDSLIDRDNYKTGNYKSYTDARKNPDWEKTHTHINSQMNDGHIFIDDTTNDGGTSHGVRTPISYMLDDEGEINIDLNVNGLGRHGFTIWKDSNNFMRFTHNTGNNEYTFILINNGEQEFRLDGTSSYSGTTSYKLTRSQDNDWEIFQDGSSLGSANGVPDWEPNYFILDPTSGDHSQDTYFLEIK